MSIVLLAAVFQTASAETCSEDADQCMQIGNATVERAGELLYVECTSACAVGVFGDRINDITVDDDVVGAFDIDAVRSRTVVLSDANQRPVGRSENNRRHRGAGRGDVHAHIVTGLDDDLVAG